ncbi:MAG: cell division protein ZapA [Flavobacteriales bacterium]
MSEEVSIHVTIATRKYPLTVAKKDQELVLKVASDIDNAVKALQSSYAIQDRQDLMAMAALQVATKAAVGTKPNSSDSDSNVTKELQILLEKSEGLV